MKAVYKHVQYKCFNDCGANGKFIQTIKGAFFINIHFNDRIFSYLDLLHCHRIDHSVEIIYLKVAIQTAEAVVINSDIKSILTESCFPNGLQESPVSPNTGNNVGFTSVFNDCKAVSFCRFMKNGYFGARCLVVLIENMLIEKVYFFRTIW